MTRAPSNTEAPAEALRRAAAGSETLAMLNGIFEAARLIPAQSETTNRSLPLTVISGFLGAGKTTLVNRLLTEPHGRRIAVLVNDFGAVNIDEELIRSRSEDTIGLANGCACCSVAGDLTKALLRLLQRPDPPDAIVLEASGLADPHGIAQVALANPAIRLDGVLTLVDGETFLERTGDPETLPTVTAQLMAADLVVLNKLDVMKDDRELIRARLRKFVGERTIFETVRADVPVDVVLGVNARQPSRFQCATEGHADSFRSWARSWDGPLDREHMMAALGQLPSHVVRAKGVFHFASEPASRTVYQRVGRRESWETEAAMPSRSHLVVISSSADWNEGAVARYFDDAAEEARTT
jgi:G3E family GTPase